MWSLGCWGIVTGGCSVFQCYLLPVAVGNSPFYSCVQVISCPGDIIEHPILTQLYIWPHLLQIPPPPLFLSNFLLLLFLFFLLRNKKHYSSGWCSSVDWVWAVSQRVAGSRLGRMPGFWARSPLGGAQEVTTH